MLDDPPLDGIQVLDFVDLDPEELALLGEFVLLQPEEGVINEIVEIDGPELPLESAVCAVEGVEDVFAVECVERARQGPAELYRDSAATLVNNQDSAQEFREGIHIVFSRIREELFEKFNKMPPPCVVHFSQQSDNGYAMRPGEFG